MEVLGERGEGGCTDLLLHRNLLLEHERVLLRGEVRQRVVGHALRRPAAERVARSSSPHSRPRAHAGHVGACVRRARAPKRFPRYDETRKARDDRPSYCECMVGWECRHEPQSSWRMQGISITLPPDTI